MKKIINNAFLLVQTTQSTSHDGKEKEDQQALNLVYGEAVQSTKRTRHSTNSAGQEQNKVYLLLHPSE